jgi:DNA-binding PucR family transcriptional regulator
MASEREELTRGTHAERREVVSLIVQGSPITASRATQRLGYALEQPHRAAVIWSEEENFQLSALEAAADVLAQSLGVPHAFSVVASAATLWVWVPSAAEVDLGRLRAAAQALEGVRIALGTVGRGLEGFRRSHLDALSTQRMLARLSAGPRVASFDMVRLVTLFTDDPERAEEFVHHTLGRLAAAPAELRDALRVFLEEGCSAARTAARLHTHRNTLLRRLARAEDLLPRPLDQHRLQVGVALEILRWERAGA